MRLFFSNGSQVVEHPTSSQIASILSAEDDFAILAETEDSMEYLQFAWTSGGVVLEYQDGSLDRHFRAASEITVNDVVRAFQDYASGNTSWKGRFKWEKVLI